MPVIPDEKPVQEKCGIVAIYSPQLTKQIEIALKAGAGVQHRGLQGAGVVLQTEEGFVKHTGNGLLSEIFTPEIVDWLNVPSLWTIVHCRYGTYGGYEKLNLQPCVAMGKDGGQIAVAHNGELVQVEKMKRSIKSKVLANGVSDTYIFTQILAASNEKLWEKKLTDTLDKINGAYNLLIGTGDKLFVARDQFGLRPLVIGKLDDSYIVASETHALTKAGAKIIREIQRGEILKIDSRGPKTIRMGKKGKGNFCDFEWAYFSRPDSLLPTHETKNDPDRPQDWVSVAEFREICGWYLADQAPIQNATFAVGIPDSGVSVTTGYAHKLKIPYRQVIIRDHFDIHGNQRLFMRDDQKDKIGSKVLGKLSIIADRKLWKNAIVVLGDDSIVRGNVTKAITQSILELGAKEVHWVIGFPPVMHRCHLGVSMRTEKELIAYLNKGNTEKIAKELGATSVNYISYQNFIKARLKSNTLTNPHRLKEIFLANGGCGGCLTGLYPIERNGKTYFKQYAKNSRS